MWGGVVLSTPRTMVLCVFVFLSAEVLICIRLCFVSGLVVFAESRLLLLFPFVLLVFLVAVGQISLLFACFLCFLVFLLAVLSFYSPLVFFVINTIMLFPTVVRVTSAFPVLLNLFHKCPATLHACLYSFSLLKFSITFVLPPTGSFSKLFVMSSYFPLRLFGRFSRNFFVSSGVNSSIFMLIFFIT